MGLSSTETGLVPVHRMLCVRYLFRLPGNTGETSSEEISEACSGVGQIEERLCVGIRLIALRPPHNLVQLRRKVLVN